MSRTRSSSGLIGFVTRHRVRIAVLLVFSMASPAFSDDRQLLQTNAGAKTDVLLILDSSTSMVDEFLDRFALPAYMDDFIYPEGTVNTSGSKFAIAKAVLRDVLTNTQGVNWAFASYRNPNPRFGSAEDGSGGVTGAAFGAGNKTLESGGLEWLYFADVQSDGVTAISSSLSPTDYPDLQKGRYLQLGHKVMRNYLREDTTDLAGSPPWEVADARPPWPPYGGAPPLSPPLTPQPGVWRGAFGPKGYDTNTGRPEGMVVYRNLNRPDRELHLTMIDGTTSGWGNRYGDAAIVIKVEEWGLPPTPTNTPTATNTPTSTFTPSPTATPTPTITFTASSTPTATATFTPSNTATFTPSNTATNTATATPTRTPTNTASNTPTNTATNTPSRTNTPSNTSTPSNTPTQTFTRSATPTFTASSTFTPTFTPSRTFTASATNTPSNTNTPTNTPSRTPTFTASNTPSPTNTFTPTFTPTQTPTGTRTPTNTNTPSNTRTPSKTQTFTATQTFTRTNTSTNTPTNTATFTSTRTPSNTPTFTASNTPSNTPTFTATNTPSNTPTFTRSNTPTNTPTNTATFTPSNTASPTATFTATATPTAIFTPSRTASFTPSNTNTPLPTSTATATFTASQTPTRTPSNTRTPTIGGFAPAGSLLPVIAKWFSPALRGLLSLAPPPPPPPLPSPSFPCPGLTTAPAPANGLLCAPCDDGNLFGDTRTGQLCAFLDLDGDSQADPRPLPLAYRGFDDPQADPNPTLAFLIQTVYIKYVRGDLYQDAQSGWPAFGPYKFGDDLTLNPPPNTGNPPWGSQSNDGDASGDPDPGSPIPDRHNQGMYAAVRDVDRYDQQYVRDATADLSCGNLPGNGLCNPYVQDCGGYAHFNSFTPVGGGTTFPPAGPPGYAPYATGDEPPSPADWPMVPFQRDYDPHRGLDADPVPAIKSLLRFASSIVSYDATASHMNEYRLEEDPRSVLVTADGTPLHGSLFDAYNYFVNTVFADKSDPAINCRRYIIVLVTDGLEECQAASLVPFNPCGARAGHPGGPSGDLGSIDLTQLASVPPGPGGGRDQAHAADPTVPLTGVPVYVVAMGKDITDPRLQCIATNSGGQTFAADNRTSLRSALESILSLKQTANSFAAPAVPAFAGGISDAAEIGAVIPSHKNEDNSASVWSIWSGSLKTFKLTSLGQIPVVTAAPATPPPTSTPGGPTATPVVSTPTPTPTPLGGTQYYPDETNPDAAKDYDLSGPTPPDRRPVWNASRMLGYTDPNTNLAGGQAPSSIAGAASAHDPNGAIKTWPGRRMIWGDDPGVDVPMTRRDFLPNTGTCTGAGTAGTCFDNLMQLMGTGFSPPQPTSDARRQEEAILTVDFLRGGISTLPPVTVPPIPFTKDRDQILNSLPALIGIARPGGIIGPNAGQQQRFSYFYQDDAPIPGEPPQVRTDGQSPPHGYAHKLGDIFHSEPTLVEPPKYFQYLSANLTPPGTSVPQPYGDFAAKHSKRRKVAVVGANDGFLHAFDAGVWDRDASGLPNDPAHPFQGTFDLGTGREIFAFAPRSIMNRKFPALLRFPPTPQYFVDGSVATADVFLDPSFTIAAGPNPLDRVWRTILVGGLRQGGETYYALDITQPDDIDAAGVIVGSKNNSPKCLDGTGSSCKAGTVSNRKYPEVLWEVGDDCVVAPGTCIGLPYMGQTWSRPVIGRIKIINGGAYEDRYVAIFGGGYDQNFKPGDTILPADVAGPPAKKATRGRSIYMVDVETGKIIYKGSQGKDDAGTDVLFAPMPAAPAVVDYNDDGYLDAVYIGDVNGRMWRLDLTPGLTTDVAPPGKLDAGTGRLDNYVPFLLYDATTSPTTPLQPVYLDPGLIFLSGGARPTIGVGWGTGDRADLTKSNTGVKRFHYVIDTGSTAKTFHEDNLTDISPPAVGPFSPNAGCAAAPTCSGFRLDFSTINEKAVSTVFSTQGFLSLVTFTPDSSNPCTTEGSSYRYSYFFLNGQGRYGTTGSYTDFKQALGGGLASAAQSTSKQGDTIDTVLFSGGQIGQQSTPGTLSTSKQNWKEQ